MEKAKKIWNDYRTGEIPEKTAVNLLLELIFKNKFEFALTSFDDDEFSEFLLFMHGRIETVLRKYNPDISDFSTYLHSVINLTAFWWKKKIQDKRIRNYCSQSMSVEEKLNTSDYSPKEKEFYVEEDADEKFTSVPQLTEMAMKNLFISRCKENPVPITKKRAKEMIKVLALKSCNNITDVQIEATAKIAGISADEMHQMVKQASETLDLKKGRISVLQNKRNFAYWQRKKKMFRERSLKNHFPDIFHEKMIEKDETRWKKASTELSVAAPLLVPSNKTVGEILNMSPRKVKKIVDEAKERYEGKNIVNKTME